MAFWPFLHCAGSLTNRILWGILPLSALRFWFPFAVCKAPNNIVTGASKKVIYFRKVFVVVRVYSSTGHFHPGLFAIKAVSQARAPRYSEIWFGWSDTPRESKVKRMSMVARGGSLEFFILEAITFCGFWEEPAEAKAEESTFATAVGSQELVMLSGNKGESSTKTSAGERRPRITAEDKSSCFRVWPRLSAFPSDDGFSG